MPKSSGVRQPTFTLVPGTAKFRLAELLHFSRRRRTWTQFTQCDWSVVSGFYRLSGHGLSDAYYSEFLIKSYHRAIVGGPAIAQLIAQLQRGIRGVRIAHCRVVLRQRPLTAVSNAGFVIQAWMSHLSPKLNEQFRLDCTYATAKADELASQVQVSLRIRSPGKAVGSVPKDCVATMWLKRNIEKLVDVGGFVLITGMTPAQLTGRAKICLSVG